MKRDEGQDLVEFALIAPLLFLLLFGIMEFGVAVWHYNTIANAAREGARTAIRFGDFDRLQEAEDRAREFAEGIGLAGDKLGVEATAIRRNDLNAVAMVVTFDYEGITGITRLLPGEITLRAQSTMITEEITEEDLEDPAP